MKYGTVVALSASASQLFGNLEGKGCILYHVKMDKKKPHSSMPILVIKKNNIRIGKLLREICHEIW